MYLNYNEEIIQQVFVKHILCAQSCTCQGRFHSSRMWFLVLVVLLLGEATLLCSKPMLHLQVLLISLWAYEAYAVSSLQKHHLCTHSLFFISFNYFLYLYSSQVPLASRRNCAYCDNTQFYLISFNIL